MSGESRLATEPGEGGVVRRVVLVGFMAAGKSVVGKTLARRLGWSFYDVDSEAAASAGAPVAEIFARAGETAFRRLEAELAAQALGRDRVVIATGGGWPRNRWSGWPRLPPGTLSVWLAVSAREGVRRARADGLALRPVLAAGDPVARAEELLAARVSAYREASVHVHTDGQDPDDIARRIARLVCEDPAPSSDPSGGTNGG